MNAEPDATHVGLLRGYADASLNEATTDADVHRVTEAH